MDGRSLNAEVIHLLQSTLEERARLERMRASSEELEQFVATLGQMPDSTSLIREDRSREL